jgi:plastocyanin
VYGIGGSIVGDLQPNGGRFTSTFRDTGVNYVTTYTCEYHQDMRGRVTVLR